MPERVEAFPAADVASEVEVEEIFKGLAPNGPGLDFGQIDVSQGKNRQRLEEHSRLVYEAKNNAGLVPAARKHAPPGKCEKARVVFRVILDSAAQDLHSIDPRGIPGRNRGRFDQSPIPDEPDASCRVIKRDLFDGPEPAEHPLALFQGCGVRIDLLDLPQAGARMSNQVVFNPKGRLRYYVKRMTREQIEILVDAPGQGVFDRNNGELGAFPGGGFKNVVESNAGNRFNSGPENFADCTMAEGARLALEGNLGSRRHFQLNWLLGHDSELRMTDCE
jgi:hypothetical protein